MFNGMMMDPELMRIAQEQMSKIPPSELAKMQEQMMSNPELLRMASERMKNMRPEDFKTAAEQMKHARVEDMAEMSKKIASASPEEIASMTAQADAQISYVLSAAQNLKKQGNDLHNQGKFHDAAQKYICAKNNLQDIPVSKGRAVQLACSLNLMSCYLKTRQYEECIKEGVEVLEYDTKNLKALYRRGQAYKELRLLEDAVSDLSKAHSVSPDDDTIVEMLRDAEDKLSKEGGGRRASKGVVIEEITEEVQTLLPESRKSSSSAEYSVTETQEKSESSSSQAGSNLGGPTTDAGCLQDLEMSPESVRSFQTLISNADPDTLAALSGGSTQGLSPDMIRTATNMMKNMPPEELQQMFKMASSFQGKNPLFPAGTAQANGHNLRPGSLPEGVSPDMMKTASDMMSKMSPEELQKMFEIASNMKGNESSFGPRTNNGSIISETVGIPAVNRKPDVGESSSSRGFSNSRSDPSPPSNLPTSMGDIQEQMRDQMNHPAMRQMFASMLKNMSPEMMANMSEQFGMNMSKEEVAKAQEAISSLSPEALDKMMRWVDRAQRGVEVAKKTRNWLFGRAGLIFAICMLILAIILHRLGYVGS
ncbi:hypothetical protein IFM89_000353 [Coptis chinensis]|uniref:Outer envelope protein 61 n=1 Tax=Coptis chinensis TaxID=261450 RepID=A0A835LHX9_9MAGN|nr:hypothetical protein IFM89_000353 [Coptis chinensis]